MYARNFNFHSTFQGVEKVRKVLNGNKAIKCSQVLLNKTGNTYLDSSPICRRNYAGLPNHPSNCVINTFRGERSDQNFKQFDGTMDVNHFFRNRGINHSSIDIYKPDCPDYSYNNYQDDSKLVLINALQNYSNGSGTDGAWQGHSGGGPMRVTCGELREKHVGHIVELVGRVHQQRQGRFVLLRDGHGSTQLVVPEHRTDLSKRFTHLPLQSYVSIIGHVSRRPSGAKNQKMETGDVEVVMEEFLLVKVNRDAQRPKRTQVGPMHARCMSTSTHLPNVLTTEEFTKCGGSKNLEARMKTRSLTCGALDESQANSDVSLLGWSHSMALPRFLQLKDGHGTIQCLLPANKPELQDIASQIKPDSIMEVKGKISRRPENCINMKNVTGGIEILVDSLAILDPDASPPPPLSQKIQVEETNKKGVNSNSRRSHTCGELRIEHAGNDVRLCGWLEHRRMGRFLTLRDAYGVTQCIIPENMITKLPNLDTISLESVLEVSGLVMARPHGTVNTELATGEVELVVSNIRVLNPATFQPFSIRPFQRAKEHLRLQHRYIDLRFPDMQYNLRTRSDMLMKMRKYLCEEHCFVEVETPTLFCRTPGGAQEFVVPTRHKGQFYSLVQSPQQFKQMLMAGSVDRYFQVARCYRDETIRGDRQPEFTQLDVEMSFAGREDIMTLMEGLLKASWPRPLPDNLPRLTYQEAMTRYGTDKPDVSYGLELQNVTDIMRTNINLLQKSPTDFSSSAILGRGPHSSITPQFRKSLQLYADEKYPKVKCFVIKIKESLNNWFSTKLNTVLGEGVMRNLAQKLELSQDDLIMLAYGPTEDTCLCLGELRVRLAEDLESRKSLNRSNGDYPLWVVDFPLFLCGKEGELETCHHPFTAPHPEDEEHLKTDPFKVRSLAYDLVMNGSEVGGGSVRAHDPIQQQELLNMLGLSSEPLEHLMNALRSGCPPHAGIALGLDRLVSIACGATSIRDVIAFPKSLEGRDPLSGAPAPLTVRECELYHLHMEEEPTSSDQHKTQAQM